MWNRELQYLLLLLLSYIGSHPMWKHLMWDKRENIKIFLPTGKYSYSKGGNSFLNIIKVNKQKMVVPYFSLDLVSYN